MRTLPASLRPWQRALTLFDAELAVALGELVTRLHGTLGEQTLRPRPRGPLSGYDGIAQRGPYERLLASEWALQDEAPDEFLRRAIAAEHVFLRPARRGGSADRRIAVLFDAGPDQLGAPRVVQLALLVLLEARAQAAEATLSFGSLAGDEVIALGLDEAGIRRFLDLRSGARPSADVGVWRARLEAARVSERWVVGAPRLEPFARALGASFVGLDDTPDRQVQLDGVLEPGARRVQRTLPLPAPRITTALLRDPFGTLLPAPSDAARLIVDPSGSLRFSRDRRRLFARGPKGRLIAYHVPSSPKAPPGDPIVSPSWPSETLVAVGLGSKRRAVGAWARPNGEIVVRMLTRRGAAAHREETFVGGPMLSGRIGLGPLVVLGDGQYLFGNATAVVALRAGAAEVLDEGPIHAVLPLAAGIEWVSGDRALRHHVVDRRAGTLERRDHPVAPAAGPSELLVFGSTLPLPHAMPRGERTYLVTRMGGGTRELTAPPGCVLRAIDGEGLLVEDVAASALIRIALPKEQMLFSLSGPLAALGISHGVLAVITASGELVHYDLVRSRIVARVPVEIAKDGR